MISQRWQDLDRLFHSALERPPEERAAFLAQACGTDEVRREVEALVAAHEQSGEFLDAPAFEIAGSKPTTDLADPFVNRILGHYKILSTLGAGGMGEVYLAQDTRLGRKIALKLLPPEFTIDAERVQRFEQEARAASALSHPNVCVIHEIGDTEDGRRFITMEYIEGITLRQRLGQKRLQLMEALDVAAQIAAGLAAAHAAGIVHRDIKPENVMLRDDGLVKVLDFGLAKLTQQTIETDAETLLRSMVKTGSGMIMGTVAYMSPEQARGLAVDSRTDIWSLGVLLYEMVAGRAPFAGATPSDMLVSILEREPPTISRDSLEVAAELDRIVGKALRKDREERYQTARELLSDLRSLKRQLEFAAQLERSVVSDATLSSLEPTVDTEDSSNTHESRRISTELITRMPTASQEQYPARIVYRPRAIAIGAALLSLLIGGFLLTYKFWPRTQPFARFQSMGIRRITNSGKAIHATLSPDGKYIVYALSDAGKQSLWIRQVSTANDKLIVPPAPLGFFGVTFSRDGNDLYYAIKAMDRGVLYRLPALGGTPVKILEGLDGPVSISPDGKQLVLVRSNYPNLGESALVIVNVDGTGERNLAIRKAPEHFAPLFFTGPSWSPDGKLVAASVGRHGSRSHVFAFAVADGKATDLTPDPWQFTAQVAWLPDMSGLLVVAGDAVVATQIWFLSYPGGERHRITNDLNTYRNIGLAADGTKFTTIQQSGLVNIWIAPDGDAKRALQLPTGNVGFLGAGGTRVSWTPDNGIVFVSTETGNLDIWYMDSKGENRRQLTTNAGQNFSPVVSPDGRYVVFTSDRAGKRNIWRMGVDGSDPKLLTDGLAEGLATISPDSRWVFYSSLVAGKQTLWRVAIEGGTPVELINRPAITPIVSPDGKFIAYLYPDSPEPLAPPNRIAIMPIEGGEPVKTFSFQGPTITATAARWSRDGRSILYTVNNNNVTNIWSQPVEGGPPRQVTDFKDRLMTDFDWSPDGKVLACTRGILSMDVVVLSDTR